MAVKRLLAFALLLFSLTVRAALPSGTVGTPYSYTLTATGGKPPYTFACGGIPTGLALVGSTGVLSGTPTVAVTNQTLTCTVTDSIPTTQPKNTTITIAASGALFMPAVNNVSANWANAGLAKIGGIPNRTTQCGATVNPSGITPPATGDDTDVINAATSACTATDFILLAPTTQTTAVVSISGNTLTLVSGTVAVHNMIMGTSIHPGTVVTSGSGTTWTVSIPPYPGQTVSNQTVTVAANVFNISLTKSILVNKAITIRGSGSCTGANLNDSICPTIVNVWDGGVPSWSVPGTNNNAECGVVSSSPVACSSSAGVFLLSPSGASTVSWGSCGSNAVNTINPTTVNCGTTLTADAAQGATSVQVTSIAHFSIGQWVMIDENPVVTAQTDPSKPGSTVNASSDFLTPSDSPATMRLAGGDIPTDYSFNPNRVNEELHQIANIGTACPGGTALTICFDDPLMLAFRQSGSHDARLYWPGINFGTVGNFLEQAGIENMSITRSAGNDGAVEFVFCAYCWVKGVEMSGTQGTGGGAVSVWDSARIQIEGNYMHLGFNLINSGNEYPIGLSERTTEALVVNNINIFGGKGMVGRAAPGNVIAYNYFDESLYQTIPSGIGDWFQEFGANASHYAGSHHNLIEGNWAYNCDNDNTHGNNVYQVIFSNWCTGLRTNFTDITANLAVSDASLIGWTNPGSGVVAQGNGFLRAAGPMAWNYWHWYGNNVLGTSGQTNAAHSWKYSSGSTLNTPNLIIWDSGWANMGTRSDPNLDGTNTPQFLNKNGNYDYFNNAIVDNDPAYSQAFPSSFYVSSKPAFFTGGSCTFPWPWVTPQQTTKIQTNSCGGSGLPAKARFDNGTPFLMPANPPIVRQTCNFKSGTSHTSPWTCTFGSAVLAGSTIYVVGMWPNFASTYPSMNVWDSLNGGSAASSPYTKLDRIDDTTNLPCGIQGTQSMGHWYLANSAAGNDTVSMGPNPITTEDWLGVVAMEVTGAGALDGHAIAKQIHLAPGTNNVTVSASNALSGRAYILATTFDESGTQAPTTPATGTGFTTVNSYWDVVTANFFTATVEAKVLTSTGSQTATFSASEPACSGTNTDYLTTMVILDY